MSDYSELMKKYKEKEREIELQKIEIKALISQNYDLKRAIKQTEKDYEKLLETRDDDDEWIYLGDMAPEEFMIWAIKQSKKYMEENSRYAFELADELQRAQYRVDDFMEVLAKAATKWASDE